MKKTLLLLTTVLLLISANNTYKKKVCIDKGGDYIYLDKKGNYILMESYPKIQKKRIAKKITVFQMEIYCIEATKSWVK